MIKITRDNSALVGKSRIAADDVEAILLVQSLKSTERSSSLSLCDILVSLKGFDVSYLSAW